MDNIWPTKKLGEICEERKEKNIYNENLPVFTVSHLYGLVPYQTIFYKQVHSKDTKNYKIVNRYDFAFGLPTKDTLPYGILENEEKVLVSPAYIVFSVRDKNLLFPRFLYYLLKTNYYKWKIIDIAKSQSATRHGLPLKFQHLADLEIPLPPLSIQQKIVKILDTIQSAVEIQDKIIEKTKELKKSLMAELFKYGGPSFRKGRKLKETEIGEIPENWEVVRLGDKKLFELIMGQSPPSSSYNQNKKGLPFLQGKAEFGEIYPQPIKWCDKPIKVAEKNDILISVRAPVGDLNLADQKYCIGRGLAAIRLKNNVNSFFMFYCLNFFKNQILNYGIGSTFKAITKEILENFLIPLPPLPEQQEIAGILQTIDQKIEIEQKKKELYEELFKTLLNKIMNQEIDVDSLDLSELEN